MAIRQNSSGLARLTVMLLVVMMVILFGVEARAMIKFAVDADPSTSGIQSTVTATSDLEFTVDIVAILDSGSDSLSSYGVSARFDTIELDLVSATELTPSGLLNLTSGVSGTSENIGNGRGEVLTFEAATFGLGPVGPTSFRVGTLTLRAEAPTGDNSDIDIELGEFNTGVDGAFDNNSVPVTPTFIGAAVAIPEPSAFGFLAIASVAAITGWRFCRRHHG